MTLFVKQVTIKSLYGLNKNKFGDIVLLWISRNAEAILTIKAWQQIDVIQDDNQIKFEPANDQYFGSELHTSDVWICRKRKHRGY